MSDVPPELFHWDGKDWSAYFKQVYSIFREEILDHQPKFQDCWVRCRKDPTEDGMAYGFWHCVTESPQGERLKTKETARNGDPARCRHIRWIRFVIELANEKNPEVSHWAISGRKGYGPKNRHLLWFREEYLVVLDKQERQGKEAVFYLVTAYPTNKKHTVEKLRKQRDSQETS